MAVSVQNYLRESGVLEKLSQNNRNYSNVSESKNIFTVFEQRMFIWHDGGSCLLIVDLKTGIGDKKDHQVLMLTNPPVFEVDCILLNSFGTLLALVGRSGVMVVVVPGYGKLLQSEKNTNFFCRSWNVAERFFVCSSRVNIMQAAWHPGSPANTHLTILSTDDYLRVYDVYDPQTPYQVVSLGSSSKCYLSTEAKDSFSYCLGESAVSFDFGPPEDSEISGRNNQWGKPSSANVTIWPIFVLHGNGDVCLVKLSMEKIRSQLIKVEGPLAMYPAADDNYGVDACSLICLHSNPPVLVIVTSSGVLYHCLLLDNSGNAENEEFGDEKAWTAYRPSGNDSNGDLALYVYESVELSLSLITEVLEDACCYPIRLHKDPTTCSRYHCTHVSGVHTVALPFIQFLEEILDKDDFATWMPQLEEKKCIVEHLLCTQPLTEVDAIPVLGLNVTVTDTGAVVICLLATWEFASLPLVSSYHSTLPSLLSSRGNISERVLLENREQSFEKHVHQLLHRSTTTPLLKSDLPSDGSKSPQQWLELVCNVTQRLREEYMQRLHTVQTEIDCRKKILLRLKQQQLLEIERFTTEKGFLQNGVEQLAEKYEDAYTKQQALLKRVENVLQHLQRRLPILSDAEVNMKKDLLSLEEKIRFYENSVEHVRAKQIYQSQKMKEFETPQKKLTSDTVSLGTSQLKHLKEILLQEGESISELVKTVCSLMKEVGI